jgi:hypothetical protein
MSAAFRLWAARIEADAQAAQLKWVPVVDLPRRSAIDKALGEVQRTGHSAIVAAARLKAKGKG